MNITFLRYIFFVLLITLVVASCKVTHSYQSPDVSTTGLYRDSVSADTNTIANLRWNEVLLTLHCNHLLEKVLIEIWICELLLRVWSRHRLSTCKAGAAFLPTINGNTSIARSKFSAGQGFGARPSITQYQFGLTSGWEADIWGRLGANRRASLANFLQSEAAVRAVQTSVVSSIANFYYLLLALDQQLLITRQTVSNWDTTVTTMRALKEAARVTEAAVVQSEAQRYGAEVTIPDLKQRIRETEHALSIILGRAPAGIGRGRLEDQQPIGVLQTGVPAQLLANRPMCSKPN
jgi:hypothetical protein